MPAERSCGSASEGAGEATAGANREPTDRPAYGYVSLPVLHAPDAEIRLRRALADFAMLEGLDLHSIFVDHRGTQPYGFTALRTLIRRTGIRLVVLPDLTHVAHIATVSALTQAGLARYLNVAVLLTTPTPATTPTSQVHR